VNIVKQAQAASGMQKVHAVLGGFRLAPYKENYTTWKSPAARHNPFDTSARFMV
jgi:metal-dependent hydrolase (beta-lactamase superfamily II)